MRNPDADSDPNEQAIDDILASLKRLDPPLETRVATRAAVASELSRIARRRQVRLLPYWQRTVPVPWPVAAAVMAMLISLSIVSVRSHMAPMEVTQQELPNDRERAARTREDTIETVPDTPTLALYESSTYLCGIGPLRSETRYLLQGLE